MQQFKRTYLCSFCSRVITAVWKVKILCVIVAIVAVVFINKIPNKMSKRKCWSTEEEINFINLWKEKEDEFRSQQKNGHIYKDKNGHIFTCVQNISADRI